MDILQLVRSLEEFLYEAMTWLLFFPRTLWRAITRPMTLIAEADAELVAPGLLRHRHQFGEVRALHGVDDRVEVPPVKFHRRIARSCEEPFTRLRDHLLVVKRLALAEHRRECE